MTESSWPDREKERMVWAHTVAILSMHLARLCSAGAGLAEIVRLHEGGIANRELDEWHAAVAAARQRETPDAA